MFTKLVLLHCSNDISLEVNGRLAMTYLWLQTSETYAYSRMYAKRYTPSEKMTRVYLRLENLQKPKSKV